MKSVAAAIAVALAVCGVSPASADEGTGNMVFYRGGFVGMKAMGRRVLYRLWAWYT